MDVYSHDNHNAAGIVRHSCGIIFILFSFLYLFFLQGEILSKAQYVFSKGTTTYSIFWGALIITVVLRLIQLPVSKYMNLPLRFHALTYIPSALLLTVICDVASSAVNGTSSGGWWFGLPFMLVVFYFLSRIAIYFDSSLYSSSNRSRSLSPYLFTNSLALIFVILACATCNSSTDVDIYEQRIERLILEGDYDNALETGKKSLSTNRRVTNLRMYALSKLGKLPDRLFDYPQYYGSDGLLCVSDTSQRLYRFDSNDICEYLGVRCDSGILTTADYFKSVVFRQQLVTDSLMSIELARSANPDSLQDEINSHYEVLKKEKKRIDDYILCGLLLDRDIDGFKEKLDKTYTGESFTDSVVPVESLPKAYREAMVMIYPEIGDTVMLELYTRFLDLRESVKDSTASSNITRRERIENDKPGTFGNTFWWYYYNPNITKKDRK